MPTPRPEMAVTSPAVERPGAKTRAVFCAGVSFSACSAVSEAGRPRLADQRVAVDAAAVVGDLDQDLVAGLARRDLERAGRAACRRRARSSGVSMPWSIALRTIWVSGSRIISIISRSSSTSPPSISRRTCLPRSARKVADHARQAGEQAVDPLHAGAGDARRASRRCRPRPARTPPRRRRRAARRAGGGRARCGRAPRRRRRSSSGRAGRPTGGSSGPICWRLGLGRGGGSSGCAGRGHAPVERGDQLLVVLAGQRFAGFERLDELADPVDHREHGADQRWCRRRGVPARTSASAPSAAWLSCSSRGRSKKPQLPFTVWTKRKISSSRSRSPRRAPPTRRSRPTGPAAMSRVSAMKSLIRSSMRPCER